MRILRVLAPAIVGAVVVVLLAVTIASAREGIPAECATSGPTISEAVAEYGRSCSPPRVDCDAIDGVWYCSSRVIGRAAPDGVSVDEVGASSIKPGQTAVVTLPDETGQPTPADPDPSEPSEPPSPSEPSEPPRPPEPTEPPSPSEPSVPPSPSEPSEPSPPLPPPVAGNQLWSDPGTWGGRVPRGGVVTVAEGQNVVLDMDLSVDGLVVDGGLSCADKDLSVTARYILVRGSFTCGTNGDPYTRRATFTLTGNNRSENVMGEMGTKFLATMGSGRIDIHGEQRTSWTRLAETASVGDRSIVVSESTDWRVGDRIVIATTSEVVDQNEERTISAVEGNRITLDSPLRFRHFGERQTFDNGKGRVWDVDTRGEVALLSRNIVIQGDAASQDANNANTGFGGHIMIMPGTEAYVSGVELHRMGQSGILARYPFHWHLAGDVSGQYLSDSSIHKSYSRCATVHGSQGALIHDNVCYDHLGHGFFLEDGFETKNVFDRNIAIRTVRPAGNAALLPSDTMNGENNSAIGPASFWISNPDNTFTNNVAVGSDGLGFWFDTDSEVKGMSLQLFPEARSMNPKRTALGVFDDNVVHSSRMAISLCNGPGGHAGYSPDKSTPTVYNRLTVYSSGDGAVWPCQKNHVFNDFRILDSGGTGQNDGAFTSPNKMTIQNSLFVANSAVAEEPKSRAAISVYDAGFHMIGLHFEGYGFATDSSIFVQAGGSQSYTSTRIEKSTLKNSPYLYRRGARHMTALASIVTDLDGSLGTGAGRTLIPTQGGSAGSTVFTSEDCRPVPQDSTTFSCPESFAALEFQAMRNGQPLTGDAKKLLTVRNYRGVEFSTRHASLPWILSLVTINASQQRALTYSFEPSLWRDVQSLRMKVLNAKPGPNQVAYFKVEGVPSSVRFDGNVMKRAGSVAEVRSQGNSWYRQGSTLHIAIRVNGTDWAETEAEVEMEW